MMRIFLFFRDTKEKRRAFFILINHNKGPIKFLYLEDNK